MESNGNSRIDPSKYVVLDVETNGLSSVRDDLLSISIYKPDTGELYNRFLPLELDYRVRTTQYNGIKTEDLVGLLPLSQEEVDEIIQDFDLKNRTILTYGNIDERFMAKYFQRHKLNGIEYFAFCNFKNEIISSRYSEGNITKDNLCALFGIKNVQSIHSGHNDCFLEWKLYERMNGNRLLITNNKVFLFNNEYIVPASYIPFYPSLKYYLPVLLQISCKSRVVFSLPVPAEGLIRFQNNFNGMMIEHLINTSLKVQRVHSETELLENKKKLTYIGRLPSAVDIIPMVFNPDGTMTASRPQDEELEKAINATISKLKKALDPLIDYIGNVVFKGQIIKSQELVVHPEKRVLALCDLSTEDAVLEIKASSISSIQYYAQQLYYEANGRKCYILITNWDLFPKEISYVIYEVEFEITEYIDPKQARVENARQKIETEHVSLVYFNATNEPVKLRCKDCGHEWKTSYSSATKHRLCPECSKAISAKSNIKRVKSKDLNHNTKPKNEAKNRILSPKDREISWFSRYQKYLSRKSSYHISALSYSDPINPIVNAKCVKCGHEWSQKADQLLEQPYCPICKR